MPEEINSGIHYRFCRYHSSKIVANLFYHIIFFLFVNMPYCRVFQAKTLLQSCESSLDQTFARCGFILGEPFPISANELQTGPPLDHVD